MDKKESKTYLEHTIAITLASKIPISRISRDTGLGDQWLRALLRGDFTDPGVNKIEKLYDYIVDVNAQRSRLHKSA